MYRLLNTAAFREAVAVKQWSARIPVSHRRH